jgi:aminopeptidase N
MNSVAAYYLSSNPGWPVYQPEWALHTPSANSLYNVAITYNKGACVLYMLRYALGDSLFFKVLKEYALDVKFRFGNAVTEDFIQKVNVVSGQDMRGFFDQWIFGRNHPIYINTFQIDSIESQNWKVTFILRQTQNNAGLFRMPVELKIQFSDGTDTIVSGINDAIEQTFGFHFLKKPVNVIFDPRNQIILKKSLTIYHVDSGNDTADNPLEQNFPNPFRESTRIKYHVVNASAVKITVLDNLGRTVDQLADHKHSPGQYILDYPNRSLKPGIYQLQMETGKSRYTRKMVVQD